MTGNTFTRRHALETLGAAATASVAGSARAAAQTPAAGGTAAARSNATPEAPARLAPCSELVNVPEFEEQAKITLAPQLFASIAGGDRSAFDRITLRPRMFVPTMDLSLSSQLFGDTLFAPIVIGPVANQKQFHPDGELATVRGAAAGKAAVVITAKSSVPFEQLVAEAKTPLWIQAFAGDPRPPVQSAVKAGARAVFVTVGVRPPQNPRGTAATTPINWAAVDALKGLDAALVVKGIMTPADAKAAVQHGAQGIVVSSYGGETSRQPTIDALPAILDAVAGKAAVLVDGSFRRGADVTMALAFGAQGVLIARPAMWGLAAYGAEGVQAVVELLQTDLARTMGMCGKSNLKMLDRTLLKVHGSAAVGRT